MLNNTGHAGKETENKYDFKREQKTGRVVADVTSVGRLFHKRLPATGNIIRSIELFNYRLLFYVFIAYNPSLIMWLIIIIFIHQFMLNRIKCSK